MSKLSDPNFRVDVRLISCFFASASLGFELLLLKYKLPRCCCCRGVSKLWYSITSDETQFFTRSSHAVSSLMTFFLYLLTFLTSCFFFSFFVLFPDKRKIILFLTLNKFILFIIGRKYLFFRYLFLFSKKVENKNLLANESVE